MDWNEFQEKALRTESIVENLDINHEVVLNILRLNVLTTELLDGIKKAVYYKNPKKFNANALNLADQISQLSSDLIEDLDALGDEILNADQTRLLISPRLFHGIVGAATESGELVSALIKGIETGEVDKTNIMEEMSDSGWYYAVICDDLGIAMGDGWNRVINKLQIRYPEKYSDENAANRDLENERRVLENK